MTVKATDLDTEENGRISYYLQVNNENVLETDEFIIDEVTGELKMKKTLNRKQVSRYELILVARDHGTPSWFETLRFLTILLVDINESHPEFPDASNPYKFFVTENGPVNARIGECLFKTCRENMCYKHWAVATTPS
jgi:Cadherin domain